jgi:hypothetical protein
MGPPLEAFGRKLLANRSRPYPEPLVFSHMPPHARRPNRSDGGAISFARDSGHAGLDQHYLTRWSGT